MMAPHHKPNSTLIPEVYMLRARAHGIRRAWYIQPEFRQSLAEQLSRLIVLEFPGTNCHTATDGTALPAPHITHKARNAWSNGLRRTQGPLQLFFRSLHIMGAAMDLDFNIHAYATHPFSLLTSPIQWLKQQLVQLANRAVCRALDRSMSPQSPWVDRELTHKALRLATR